MDLNNISADIGFAQPKMATTDTQENHTQCLHGKNTQCLLKQLSKMVDVSIQANLVMRFLLIICYMSWMELILMVISLWIMIKRYIPVQLNAPILAYHSSCAMKIKNKNDYLSKNF